MTIKIQGTIADIQDEQQKGNFSWRNLWLDTLSEGEDPKYTQQIEIQFPKDKGALLEGYRIGEKVEVEVNLRGKEVNGRRWNNLSAWKISHYGPEPAKSPFKEEPPAQYVPDEDLF